MNSSVVLAKAAELMGLPRDAGANNVELVRIRHDDMELGLRGNAMSCNSVMITRVLLIPPFHLALLKHEGLPVTLIASMDATQTAEDAARQAPSAERVCVYVRKRREYWSSFGEATGTRELLDRIQAAWVKRVKHVDLLRNPDWRRLKVLAVHGRVVSALELDEGANMHLPTARNESGTKRVDPRHLGSVDWAPLSRAAEILGMAIGTFNLFLSPAGQLLIAGFSDRVPWNQYCVVDGEFDTGPAIEVLRQYFRIGDA